jgi:hypothetical protein
MISLPIITNAQSSIASNPQAPYNRFFKLLAHWIVRGLLTMGNVMRHYEIVFSSSGPGDQVPAMIKRFWRLSLKAAARSTVLKVANAIAIY